MALVLHCTLSRDGQGLPDPLPAACLAVQVIKLKHADATVLFSCAYKKSRPQVTNIGTIIVASLKTEKLRTLECLNLASPCLT